MKLQTTKLVTLRLPPFKRVYITLVGCGGTGSHLASGLATLALALKDKDVKTNLTFFDPDRVEEKNVGRQLFTMDDLGKFKSTVLNTRIYSAYKLFPEDARRAIDGQDTFIGGPDSLNIVIGAVDNAAARKTISLAVAAAAGALWWLDCGNENHSGQIALGNSVDPKRWKPALGMVDALPAPHVVYPDLIQKRKAKAVSCADAVEQGLMTNRMVAAWALSMLNDFLLGQLRYFTVAFDLTFGGVQSRALDEPTLKGVAYGKA